MLLSKGALESYFQWWSLCLHRKQKKLVGRGLKFSFKYRSCFMLHAFGHGMHSQYGNFRVTNITDRKSILEATYTPFSLPQT